MNVNIPLKRAIQTVIFLLMVFVILLIWPFNICSNWKYSGEANSDSISIVENESTILQDFTPELPGLAFIDFYIYNEEIPEGASLIFYLFDGEIKQLDKREVFLDKLSLPGPCRIKINSEIKAGERCYFVVDNAGTNWLFASSDGINIDIRYEYKMPLTDSQYLFYGLTVLFIGVFLMILTEMILRKSKRFIRFDFGIRLSLAITASAAFLWLAYQVFPGKRFSTNWIDNLFYEIGIFLFLAVLLCGLLYKREETPQKKIKIGEVCCSIPGVLQSFAFAGVMLGCVRYANALNSYHQKLAVNIVLASFALAIIFSYTKKEIFNWYHIIYLVFAIAGAVRYCYQHNDHIEHWNVAKGTAISAVLWGIVVINTIRIVILNKKNKVSVFYMLALLALILEMVRSRNTRTWPIEIAVYWGLFAIRVAYKGRVKQYLNHFSYGVFIHFIGISIYAMLYRPFHYYSYIRYPSVFHTVTMAAVYFTLVLILALVRFLYVYRTRNSLLKSWKEIMIMGMASGFLVLTISRTGLLAAIILCPSIILITAFVEYGDKLIGAIKRLLLFAGIVVGSFVAVFTLCRLIPAIVGNPFTYEIEKFVGSVREGEEWDSRYFATVPRFFGVADAKISYYGDLIMEDGKGQITNEGADAVQDFKELPSDLTAMGANTDYSNGRWDIYKAYLQALDWKGHDSVSLQTEEETIMHAHNSFIQTAYDFGLGAGIYFLVFCIFAGVRSIYYYIRHRKESTGMIPVVLLGAFGICGMVEKVFFPYMSMGFAFLFVLVLLIPSQKMLDKTKQEVR